MNERPASDERHESEQPEGDGNVIAPLPGEAGIPDVAQRPGISISKKGLLAVVLLIATLVIVAGFTIQRFTASGKKDDDAGSKLAGNRPTAATTEPRRLEVPVPLIATAAASTPAATGPRIPAIVPTAEELAEPIGVRRTGAGAPGGGNTKTASPEDAPVLLVTSRPGSMRTAAASPAGIAEQQAAVEGPEPAANDPIANTARNLQGYQRQLQGLMETLARSTAAATGQATGQVPTGALLGAPPIGGTALGAVPIGAAAPGTGLFGGQLQGSGVRFI